jgi:hypothetical protein
MIRLYSRFVPSVGAYHWIVVRGVMIGTALAVPFMGLLSSSSAGYTCGKHEEPHLHLLSSHVESQLCSACTLLNPNCNLNFVMVGPIIMRFRSTSLFAAAMSMGYAQTHGEGEEGTSMGPVAFFWPADRAWDARNDNTAPCGSSSGPNNRTAFPLSQGSVALTIADEAWHVAFRLAVSNGVLGTFG